MFESLVRAPAGSRCSDGGCSDGGCPDDRFLDDWLPGMPDPEAWAFDQAEWDAAPEVSEPDPGSWAPSGWFALEVDTGTADVGVLSDEALVEGIVGFDRVASWAAARQARLLAELVRRRPADGVPQSDDACAGSRFVPDEVGVALTLARGTAAGRIGTACRLLRVLPETHALWEAGRIDTARARAVEEATAVLSDELARRVQERVLRRAPEQSLARLRAALARAVLAVDPDGAAARHRVARRDRRVSVQPEPDGMGSLWALLTADDASGAFAWLTRLARGLGADDPRPMDVRRADLLAALLNGRLVPDVDAVDPDPDGAAPDGAAGVPGRMRVRPVTPGKPLVQVVMAHSTLVGADDQPAELVGHGPIPADLAREIAADAVWRRLVTDPLSGTVLDYGHTTYHPPVGLADHVRARDLYCRFPHCRRRAADAELDHVTAWVDGGETCEANLRACCLHHHKLKTHAGWRVEAHPDGRLTWVTPTGHRHTTAPHDYGPEPPGPAAGRSEARRGPDLDPPPF